MSFRTAFSGACVATALMLAWNSPVSADTLTIDSSQSFLKLAVSIDGTPIATAQVPGSDTTYIAGTLEATVSGGNITFDGGSVLDFLEFDGGNTDLLPAVGGGSVGDPGTPAPADYGLLIDLGIVSGYGAVRLALADVTGGPEAIAGNAFDTSNLTLALTDGDLDVNLSGFANIADSVDISGNMALNSSGGNGYTTVNNGMQYVVLPIDLEVVIPVEISPGVVLPITAAFTGQVVTVPEPTTMALLGVACAVVPAVGYRRMRRRA